MTKIFLLYVKIPVSAGQYSSNMCMNSNKLLLDVFKLVELKADISNISVEEYKTRSWSGDEYYHIPHSVEMEFHAAAITYTLLCGEVRSGSVEIVFA